MSLYQRAQGDPRRRRLPVCGRSARWVATRKFIAWASGPYLYDTDGREYVDAVGSWGPALLGHAHPEVVRAVQEAAARGLSFERRPRPRSNLAEAVRGAGARGGQGALRVDRHRGGMTAIRLARGATGRDLIIKFAGCYHGHSGRPAGRGRLGVATKAGVCRGDRGDGRADHRGAVQRRGRA